MKDEIQKILKKVSNQEVVYLEPTENMSFGDYSSNIAMQMATKDRNPREIAEELKEKLISDTELVRLVDKIDIAGPGFINFWIKKDTLIDNLIYIGKEKERYGRSDLEDGKLAIVEYSSPNIAKPFTVGHLRSTIIGDAIANILEAVGYKVIRDNHLGDWGTQFGKQIYAIKAWGDEEKIGSADNPVKELVDLYVKFHTEAEKDPGLEDTAREWFKKLENGDTEAKRLWRKCIDWSFKEFDRIYEILNIKFSSEFEKGRGLGESFFEDKMAVIVDELAKKGLLGDGESGAKLVFFDNSHPPLMILKKDGASLYATRDLATDKYRKDTYNPDLIVNEVGIEQSLYFKQIFEIEELLGWYKKGQRIHVGHGLIRFKEGKMSTRKGNVIWMQDVLDEAVKRAVELGSVSNELSQMVAVGALKYNDLKRDPKTDIVFDWDEILNMEGNSGPYLQYTHARIQSVLNKSEIKDEPLASSSELNEKELLILRTLSRFPGIVLGAAKNYSPNLICNYLYDLASKYNTFYNKHKIIGSENKGLRTKITSATGQVIKNGLTLLGIQLPARM